MLSNCGVGKLLRVSWTARSNQSVLKEISPEYSLEGLMPKLQYSGHLMRRTNSLEKTLMLERLKAGGEGVNRGWDGWMTSLTRWTQVWVGSGVGDGQGTPGVLQSMGWQRVWHDWLTYWTELNRPDKASMVLLWHNCGKQWRRSLCMNMKRSPRYTVEWTRQGADNVYNMLSFVWKGENKNVHLYLYRHKHRLRKNAWEMSSDDRDYWMMWELGEHCFLMPVVDTATLFFP